MLGHFPSRVEVDILGGGRQNIRRQMENDSSLIFSPLSHEIYDENQKVGEVFYLINRRNKVGLSFNSI